MPTTTDTSDFDSTRKRRNEPGKKRAFDAKSEIRPAQPPAARPQAVEPISRRFPALEEQEVVLTFLAPDARIVQVAGTFNGWNPAATPLESTGPGEWTARLMLRSGQYEYRFIADGVWSGDPQAEETAANPFGGLNSVLRVGLDDRTDLL